MTLDSLSLWDWQSNQEYKHNYEAVFTNVLFISTEWLEEMTLSCWIYYEQCWKQNYESDFILCELQTALLTWIWIPNQNQ